MINIYKKIIENYINTTLNPSIIKDYASNNNFNISSSESIILYNFIKENYKSILNGNSEVLFKLKLLIREDLYEEVEKLYSKLGRKSIDPVVLIKIHILKFLFHVLFSLYLFVMAIEMWVRYVHLKEFVNIRRGKYLFLGFVAIVVGLLLIFNPGGVILTYLKVTGVYLILVSLLYFSLCFHFLKNRS